MASLWWLGDTWMLTCRTTPLRGYLGGMAR